MITLRIASLLLAAGATIATAADDAVLCRGRARTVAERAACRPRETPIPLTAVGPAGPTGPDGPAGAPGRGAASIVDAAGTVVGPVFALSRDLTNAYESTAVALAAFDHEAVGGLTALGIRGDGRAAGYVYYAEAECTGTPLVPTGRFVPELQAIEETVFFPTPAAPATPLRSLEGTDFSSGCVRVTARGGCCTAVKIDVRAGVVAEAGHTTLAELGLRAPFHARGE